MSTIRVACLHVILAAAVASGTACSTRDDGTSASSPPVAPSGAEPVTAAPAAPAAAPTAATGPYSLEYRMITKAPTCRGNHRIKVDDRGGVFEAINDADCPQGTAWQKPYPTRADYQMPDAERGELRALVERSGVLALPALSTDPRKAPSGGFREELEITLDGRTTVVAVEHTEVEAFSRVRQALIDLASR